MTGEPSPLVAAFRRDALAKGKACPAITPRYVPTPQDHATAALIAGMAARQAVG